MSFDSLIASGVVPARPPARNTFGWRRADGSAPTEDMFLHRKGYETGKPKRMLCHSDSESDDCQAKRGKSAVNQKLREKPCDVKLAAGLRLPTTQEAAYKLADDLLASVKGAFESERGKTATIHVAVDAVLKNCIDRQDMIQKHLPSHGHAAKLKLMKNLMGCGKEEANLLSGYGGDVPITNDVQLRIKGFFASVDTLAASMQSLFFTISTNWRTELVFEPKSLTKLLVDRVKFPNAKFGHWFPLQPVYLYDDVLKCGDGLSLAGAEIHEKRRKAYPVHGPFEYAMFQTHEDAFAAAVLKVARRQRLSFDQQQALDSFIAQHPGHPNGTPITEVDVCNCQQFETKLQETLALFTTVLKTFKSTDGVPLFSETSIQIPFFLSALQSPDSFQHICDDDKDDDHQTPNQRSVWSLILIHYICKIHDSRLNNRYKPINAVQKATDVRAEKTKVNRLPRYDELDGPFKKASSLVVFLLTQWVFSLHNLRHQAFTRSGMLEDKWKLVDEASGAPILETNRRKNTLRNWLYVHKSDASTVPEMFNGGRTALFDADGVRDASVLASKTCNFNGSKIVSDTLTPLNAVYKELADFVNKRSSSSSHVVDVNNDEDDDEEACDALTRAFGSDSDSEDNDDDGILLRSSSSSSCDGFSLQSCQWLSCQNRLTHATLLAKIDSYFAKLDRSLAFVEQSVKIHNLVSQTYIQELLKCTLENNALGITVDEVEAKDIAINRSISAASTTEFFGTSKKVIEDVVGRPGRWNCTSHYRRTRVEVLETSKAVLLEYRNVVTSDVDPNDSTRTFFDFTDAVHEQIETHTEMKAVPIASTADSFIEFTDFKEYFGKPPSFVDLQTRLHAFKHQPIDFVDNMTRLVRDIFFVCCGELTQMENCEILRQNESQRCGRTLGVSSLLAMLSVAYQRRLVCVEDGAASRDVVQECASTDELHIFRIGDRNITIASAEQLKAISESSENGWSTVCILAEMALRIHRINRSYSKEMSFENMTREHAWITLCRDGYFFQVNPSNKNAFFELIGPLYSRVASFYPKNPNWKFSDAGELCSHEQFHVLCTWIPNLLAPTRGFINVRGLKDRWNNVASLKIPEVRRMFKEGSRQHFDEFFVHSEFGKEMMHMDIDDDAFDLNNPVVGGDQAHASCSTPLPDCEEALSKF